jgi:hypothetical protein
MAHGSNVQGLLTTATYMPETRSLVLNTPRNSRGVPIGAKWWVGNIGKHATHAVVAAKLVVNSVQHGVHFFLVQLRDPQTMQAVPRVVVGVGFKKSTADQFVNAVFLLGYWAKKRAMERHRLGVFVSSLSSDFPLSQTMDLSCLTNCLFLWTLCWTVINALTSQGSTCPKSILLFASGALWAR